MKMEEIFYRSMSLTDVFFCVVYTGSIGSRWISRWAFCCLQLLHSLMKEARILLEGSATSISAGAKVPKPLVELMVCLRDEVTGSNELRKVIKKRHNYMENEQHATEGVGISTQSIECSWQLLTTSCRRF